MGRAGDFVLTLVLGDLVDDAIWGEAPLVQFIVAATTLALAHSALSWQKRRRPSGSVGIGA